MLVPQAYNNRLEPMIDKHTKFSIIPNKYLIHYFDIALDICDFLEKNISKKKKILEIGGRTFPSLDNNKDYDISGIEDRRRYKDYLHEYLDTELEDINQLKSIVKNYDIIMIHADYIAESGYEIIDLYRINEYITSEQNFFIIEYNWENFNNKTIIINDDGTIYNLAQYKDWFNKVRNHMHLGYKIHKYHTVNITDLSYFY